MAILGIHSNVYGREYGIDAGHAWISVTRGGNTRYYGLWPDDHPLTVDNDNLTDIRIDLEAGYNGAASRYYRLSPPQISILEQKIKENVGWRYTNTCASWVSDVVYSVLKVDIDADDTFGFETPRELGASILKLEEKDPTSRLKPTVSKTVARDSSSRTLPR